MNTQIAKDHSKENHASRGGGTPLAVAIVIAVFGVLGMMIVDHGPWNKPEAKPAVVANYSTTGEAARAVGAKVVPTDPRLKVEPDPSGPKPVHPANPVPP